jgi:hypothetical protein
MVRKWSTGPISLSYTTPPPPSARSCAETTRRLASQAAAAAGGKPKRRGEPPHDPRSTWRLCRRRCGPPPRSARTSTLPSTRFDSPPRRWMGACWCWCWFPLVAHHRPRLALPRAADEGAAVDTLKPGASSVGCLPPAAVTQLHFHREDGLLSTRSSRAPRQWGACHPLP